MKLEKKWNKKLLNKKSVSLMLSYVILIVIAITMAIAVYAWLRIVANVKPVESCEEETSMILDSYKCVNENLKLFFRNNGRFSIDGFILFVGSDTEKIPTSLLIPLNAEQLSKEGYFIFKEFEKPEELGPEPIEEEDDGITGGAVLDAEEDVLVPGETEEAIFSNRERKQDGGIGKVNFDYIRNIKIQLFIIHEESGDKILCENIIRQELKNCKINE